MIRINLIPHRSEFRQQQIIEHLVAFTSVILLVIALVIVVDVFSTQSLTDLQDEEASLRMQNATLSKKIGELRNLDSLRKEVEDKLQIVDDLQAGRFRSLNTLNAIAESIPQNIWISTLTDSSGSLALRGFGESSKAVANFMRALDSSVYFNDVHLTVDEEATVDGIGVRKFELTFHRLSLAEQEALIEAQQEGASK